MDYDIHSYFEHPLYVANFIYELDELTLSDDEKNLLEAKWKLSGLPSKAACIGHLIVYGFVYDIDYSELKQYNTALSQINNNMNQIARKANTYDMATKEDIQKVKEMMDELWHIQRSMLSKQPLTRQ